MIKVNSSRYIPQYQTKGAVGMDLQADIDIPITLEPGQRRLIPTGITLTLPPETEAQIRPRSGLALKHGVTVLNTPGTIDTDYEGEVGVILINHGEEPFTIEPGMRIAQMVFNEVKILKHETAITDTVGERGDKGFGSTGEHEIILNNEYNIKRPTIDGVLNHIYNLLENKIPKRWPHLRLDLEQFSIIDTELPPMGLWFRFTLRDTSLGTVDDKPPWLTNFLNIKLDTYSDWEIECELSLRDGSVQKIKKDVTPYHSLPEPDGTYLGCPHSYKATDVLNEMEIIILEMLSRYNNQSEKDKYLQIVNRFYV